MIPIALAGAYRYTAPAFSLITAGLISRWPLQEGTGTTITDTVGGRNGTTHGIDATNWVSAIYGSGYSLKFNGSDEYADNIGALSDYSFIQNTAVFSICLWMKLVRYDYAELVAMLGNTASTVQKGFSFWFQSGTASQRYLECYICKGGSPVVIDSKSNLNVITNNNPHHVAVTGNGTNCIFYVDGVAVGGSSSVGTLSSGDSTNKLNIGRTYSAPFFYGQEQDVRIYNTTLTPAQIATIASGLG